MAFCPNCGTPNTDQAEKCVACGFELIVPKQKAKFKGTIMMSGIKAPTQGETKEEVASDQPTEPPPKPAAPPPAAPAAPAPETGRNPNYAKTMMGHAPVVAPPRKLAETTVEESPPPSAPVPPPAEPARPASAPSFEPVRSAAASSSPQVIVAEDNPPPSSASSSWTGTGTGAPRAQSRAGVGGYDSTVPPSAPPTPKPGKIIALGCAAALALFCVVGSILYYVVGAKVRSMMGADDTGAEAAAWQASILQSLAQVSELCKTDCVQASVYFHPLKEAGLLSEAKALTPERLQKLSDPAHTEATMLNGTDDEAVATQLGLDPQQCARVSVGGAKVISCSVPDPGGKPSVLRIVELAGVSSL